jgi:MFS family permease
VQLPQAVGVIMLGRVVALKYPQIGPKKFLLSGVTGASAATFGLLFVQSDSPLWLPALLFFFRGVFMAQVFIPLNAATFSQISPRDTGNASALYQTVRQIGGALGVAFALTVLFSRMPGNIIAANATLAKDASGALRQAAVAAGQVVSFHEAVIAAATMAGLGLIGVFFIRDADAAASMGKSSAAGH